MSRRSEAVEQSAHYGGGADPYEAIKVIEAWGLGFHLGNAVKYICRAGQKGGPDEELRDLQKARWYVNRFVEGLESPDEANERDRGARITDPVESEPTPAEIAEGVSGFVLRDARLCYVEGGAAYFTTQPVEDQRGDDWNDRPYEHNAGRPYDDRDAPLRMPRWRIFEVPFTDVDLVEPSDGYRNSPYSVEDINRAQGVPWLRTPDYVRGNLEIWAGTSYPAFVSTIEGAGGTIWVPRGSTGPKEKRS